MNLEKKLDEQIAELYLLDPKLGKAFTFIKEKVLPIINNLVKSICIITSFSLTYKKIGFENTLIIQGAIVIFLLGLLLQQQGQKNQAKA